MAWRARAAGRLQAGPGSISCFRYGGEEGEEGGHGVRREDRGRGGRTGVEEGGQGVRREDGAYRRTAPRR